VMAKRPVDFWKTGTVGGLSERESTRDMRLFTRRWRGIVRIMVDHHMDAWLHRRAVICMRTADVWALLL